MTGNGCTNLRLVIKRTETPSDALIHDLEVPSGAGIDDLLLKLQKESPEIYEEIRSRVLDSARSILAYGSGNNLMSSLNRGLSEGGTIVFPEDSDLSTAFFPQEETENQH